MKLTCTTHPLVHIRRIYPWTLWFFVFVFVFLIMDTLVQRWDNFLPKGLEIFFLLLWREGSIMYYPFYRDSLRTGQYTTKYKSQLSIPICLHEMDSTQKYKLGKCLLASTRNPLQNCFQPPPFTCSASSLFALSLLIIVTQLLTCIKINKYIVNRYKHIYNYPNILKIKNSSMFHV